VGKLIPTRRVLIPSDAPARGEIERVLKEQGWQPLPYSSAGEAETSLASDAVGAVILQHAGQPTTVEFVKKVRRVCPGALLLGMGGDAQANGPDVVLGDRCSPEEVAAALRAGTSLRDLRTAERALRDKFRALERHARTQATRIKELEASCAGLKAWGHSVSALALRDELTGLYNRRYFLQVAKQEVERCRRRDSRFALAMVDIDHFKQYNDTYGHPAGDEMLKTFSRILLRNVRRMDTVARYGGEEFVLLLPETRMTEDVVFQPVRLLERLRAAVDNHVFANESHLTMSAGVAEYPTSGGTVDEVMAEVDARLYRAKAAGRNRVCATGA